MSRWSSCCRVDRCDAVDYGSKRVRKREILPVGLSQIAGLENSGGTDALSGFAYRARPPK